MNCLHNVKTGTWHNWTCLSCGHHEVLNLHGGLATQTVYDEENPYGHDFDVHESRCSPNCGACAWAKEKVERTRRRAVFEMKERLGYPTELVTPTPVEIAWLREYHILWEGDCR